MDEDINPINDIYDRIAEFESEGMDDESISKFLKELFAELGHDEQGCEKMSKIFLSYYRVQKMNPS